MTIEFGISDDGKRYIIRIIDVGSRYGRLGTLVNDTGVALVELYIKPADSGVMLLISRYEASAIMGIPVGGGLTPDVGRPDIRLDWPSIRQIQEMLYEES